MAGRMSDAVLDKETSISMYRDFGAVVDQANKTVQFRLFFPDNRLDSGQYIHEGGDSEIQEIRIVGTFQDQVRNLKKSKNWQPEDAPIMRRSEYPTGNHKGWLWQSDVITLPDGFYQYKYYVTHAGETWSENRGEKYKNDPCTKYHNYQEGHDNSGFVIGGSLAKPEPIKNRLPLKDLIIYEVMLDDYVRLDNEKKGGEAFLETFMRDIDRIKSLGVNAIEFMPWTAWPGGGFNWGYEPFLFFSVTNVYTGSQNRPLDKLALLNELITELHRNDIHVIMDGVFNHVREQFPYYQMYKNEMECPYTGSFGEGDYFKDLDFHNGCTQEFIFEVCRYWIEEFRIDGIRFDYTKGFYEPSIPDKGLGKLIGDLNEYIAQDQSRLNVSLILEHLDGYNAINVCNKVNASGCWLDPFMSTPCSFLENHHVDQRIIEILNSHRWFSSGDPVTYIENHDHSTLTGKMIEYGYQGSDWAKTQPYAIALLTSPGAPMIYNGQEYGRIMMMPEPGHEDEWGVKRVKSRPIEWDKLSSDPDGQRLFWLYSTLIWIRKSRPGLRSWEVYPKEISNTLNEMGYGFDEEKQVAIYHRYGDDGNGTTEYFIVALNFSDEPQTVDIPFTFSGTWYDLLNNEEPVEVEDCWLREHEIPANWGRVFVGRR
ncbi:MAG: alpha-amylase family glycosyl hydrolase [Vulcanimicrobiota bacterium]